MNHSSDNHAYRVLDWKYENYRIRHHPARASATQAASQLIAELDAYLSPLYPQESQHGYSIEKLVEQGVEFFVLCHDGEPAACGGAQFFAEPQEE